MPDAIITATESTFGTISGTFSADQSTVTGTVSGVITGTLDGSVGVPGPAGPGVPVGGTAGQYLQKIDGTNYNTDWVTLNLAAYAPLAGATFTGVVGFNGASGNVAAKSTGYFKAYTSGSESTDYSLQYDTGLQVVVGGTTVARIASSGILAPSAGITFSDASTQTSAGITAATAASTYYLQTNPDNYITSAALSGYATESFVTSQGYITSSALTPYLTTATAASTYFTIASAANKADLASPALTGTPTAPTASPGTDTTQLATTAFVTAAVPALATLSDARQFTNDTKVMSPRDVLWSMLSQDFINIDSGGMTATNTGTISAVQLGQLSRKIRPGNAGACSSRIRTFGPSQVDQTWTASSRAQPSSFLNFSLRSIHSGRSTTSGVTDANYTCAVYYGKAEADGVGNLTRRGYGWKMVGGAGSRFIELQAHNGTTLSSVTSSFAVTAGVAFDWDIESDGAGNVTLYVNGSSVAASTGGPTGSVSLTAVAWQEEVAAAAALSSPYLDFVNSRGRYIVINTW